MRKISRRHERTKEPMSKPYATVALKDKCLLGRVFATPVLKNGSVQTSIIFTLCRKTFSSVWKLKLHSAITGENSAELEWGTGLDQENSGNSNKVEPMV